MKKIALLFLICNFYLSAKSQFQTSGVVGPPPLAFRYGETQIAPPALTNLRAIGIGNFSTLGGGATPQARLHVNSFFFPAVNAATAFLPGELFRTDGSQTNINAWRMFTGVTATTTTEKFSLSIPGNTSDVILQATDPGSTNLPTNMRFNVGGTIGNPVERMRIVGTTYFSMPPSTGLVTTYPVKAGNVGIGTMYPGSKLHIGNDIWYNSGYRDWMDIGTYYSQGTDNMYFGFGVPNNNQAADAIINWGNNPSTVQGPDRLRFVFTAAVPGGFTASGVSGLEIARMVTDGNKGRMGIGNFLTPNVDPVNTLEIRSDVAPTVLNPISSASQTRSGLRFTNLKSTLTVDAPSNSSNTVLSVNDDGDVILVRSQTGGTLTNANNGTSLSGGNTVQLGNIVGATSAQLLSDREIPMNSKNIIFSGAPDIFPGKVGFGIIGGINNASPQSLRSTPTTMQVNGSLSIFDGSGNSSVFFGEEQFAYNSGVLGEWGIQYFNGGLNFWKPSGSHGIGFGNNFLFLSDNGNVGIGATASTAPSNALEISSYPSNPGSGLRFSNLDNTGPISSFVTSNYLSVDNNGDVILVAGSTGTILAADNGTTVNNTPNSHVELGGSLHQNTDIVLNNNNLTFSDPLIPTSGINNIGIGTATPFAKLTVANSTTNTAGSFVANGAFTNLTGIVCVAQNGSGNVIGVNAAANSNVSTAWNSAIRGVSGGSSYNNEGGYFQALGTGSIVGQKNYGVHCNAASLSGINYGIHSSANVGPNSWAGWFQGNISGVGDVVLSGNTYSYSDSSLKKNINPIIDALNLINQLNPRKFDFRTADFPNLNLPVKNQFGLIAQEVELILPALVNEIIIPEEKDSLGNIIFSEKSLKALNYNAFIPIAIEGIKELDSITTNLANQSVIGATNGCFVNTNKQVELGTNKLDHNTVVPMNNNNFGFGDPTNPTIGTNIVRIGDLSSKSVGKFNVNNTTESITGLFESKIHTSTSNQNIAVMGDMYGIANAANYAGYFNTSFAGGKNFGVFAQADGGTTNYGIYASVHGNYPNNVAGYFNGDVYSTGSYLGSDAILKDNVAPLTNAMGIINQISPKTFTYKTGQYPQMNLPTGSQFGMIAQDVEGVLPNLVKEVIQPEVLDTAGNIVNAALTFKSLKYEAFIPILIQGAKEQQSTIDSLKTQIQDLQNQMAQVLNNNSGGAKIVNTINIELSNDAVLYQNIPNPFTEETTINYFIPENTGNAKIIFFDMYGQSMKDVQLTTTGSGNIHVDSKNLASGIYSYSLVIDGKIIDTKKMVKSK